jgi:hypothetical protein
MMKRSSLVSVALVAALLTMIGSASAETTKICVPEKPSKPVLSPSASNECPTKSTTKYKQETLPSPAELEALGQILPHVKYVESGVGSKPTIQFSGVNVQIVNGEGKTKSANGEGNLELGYDEDAQELNQTGSHNLVLGESNNFTSWGGIVAGKDNSISAPLASVLGGAVNEARKEGALVVNGILNTASGFVATVIGGNSNGASGKESTVSGGRLNVAKGTQASVSGGVGNVAGVEASVSGGNENVATGQFTSISGGFKNKAEGSFTSISGGERNLATGEASSISGGFENKAEGLDSSIFGGKELTASGEYEAIP